MRPASANANARRKATANSPAHNPTRAARAKCMRRDDRLRLPAMLGLSVAIRLMGPSIASLVRSVTVSHQPRRPRAARGRPVATMAKRKSTEEAAGPAPVGRHSALLDTRVIYCGACLDAHSMPRRAGTGCR